jgi:hypothetical protein
MLHDALHRSSRALRYSEYELRRREESVGGRGFTRGLTLRRPRVVATPQALDSGRLNGPCDPELAGYLRIEEREAGSPHSEVFAGRGPP